MSMNNNSNQQNLCKQGCGFYGNAQNMDMCSKCYQNFLKTSNQEPTAHSQSGTQSPFNSPISISEIYQSRSKIVESGLHQCKDSRKRTAQSELESLHKVPKSCKIEGSDQYGVAVSASVMADTDHMADMFVTDIDSTAAQPNSVDDRRNPDEASPVNLVHSVAHSTKKPRRCEFCRRKVGLTGFDCRCGGHFCAVHRYSDKHSCTFDYQAHGQEQIKHQNPMICGSKIKKI